MASALTPRALPLLALAAMSTLSAGCPGRPAGGGAGEARVHAPSRDAGGVDAARSVELAALGLPALAPPLDDPRLAGARDHERAHDPAGAARIVAAARAAHPEEPAAACTWAYLEGRYLLAANQLPEAAAAFELAAGTRAGGSSACSLSGYATLRASQAHARAGQWEMSVARARAVQEGSIVLDDELRVTLAEALSAHGERPAAVAIWRDALRASPTGARWIDTAVRLATGLLDGVDGPPATHAREAFELATRVVVEAPRYAESSGAALQRARAFALLRQNDHGLKDALSEEQRARLVQAWLDSGDPTKALAEANAAIAPWPSTGKVGAVPCKVAYARAQAMTRTKAAGAADGYGDAIRACLGEDLLASALYHGGKASLSAKRPQEASERYEKLEQQFPRHRLADDARLLGALILKDQGDDARFASMLLALPDDYPEGDMRGEALFRVALARMVKGDWAGAKDPLERILVVDPDDRHPIHAGRAAYFRARVSAMSGDDDDARERYAKVIEAHPLTFYMTQAYARLAAYRPELAAAALARAVDRETSTRFFTRPHPELASPAVERAARLLEVGETEIVRREFARAGLTGDGADSETLWAIAHWYNLAGAPEIGHSFARSRLKDHLAHYPAGGWRLPWETAYPRAFEPLVLRECEKTGTPLAVVWAVMREESTFVAEAKSPANAFGLMQLIVPTAKVVSRGTGLPWDPESLKRPEVSVALGARMLAQLRSVFANRALAISAYNAGQGATQRWLGQRGALDFDLFVEEIPYEETRLYVKKVLGSQAAYGFLYARPSFEEVLALPLRADGAKTP